MAKENTKHTKPSNESSSRKTSSKSNGRSFCCSMFIYTFVFVSGVVVATILPDLVGHHFKQPYGKEYALMAEQIFNNLPKHLHGLSETAHVIGRDFADRVWMLKDEVVRKVESFSKTDGNAAKTKSTSPRSSAKPTTHANAK